MFHSGFEKTTSIASDFSYANLSYSKFMGSNAKRSIFNQADVNNVDFSSANLYKTDFTRTHIKERQLESALSIQYAVLPNGTLAHDSNLIHNGQADCNISLVDSWILQDGNVTTVMTDTHTSNCQFILQSFTLGATMSQRVDLSNKWDSNSWPHSTAILSASMSSGVSIQLIGINNDGLAVVQQTLSKFQYISISVGTSSIYRLD